MIKKLTRTISDNLLYRLIFSTLVVLLFSSNVNAQVGACSPNSPIIEVDLSNNPDSIWSQADVNRTLKNCCGRPNNEPCVKFKVTLHPDADGIVFSIIDGATPPIIEWQLMDEANTECEAPARPADELVCLDGVGPYYVVFCKPGNNKNEYQISSVQETEVSDAVTVSEGCQDTLIATGYDEATIVWTSVFPGARGDYDGYLSCTSNCDTVIVTATPGYPAFIDYELSGSPAAGCDAASATDTVRVFFVSTLDVNIEPSDPAICFGGTGTVLDAVGSGGAAPYTYLWSTGETSRTIIATTVGDYWVQVEDTTNCGSVDDTVTVTKFLSPITAEAGDNQTVCANSPSADLEGVVTEATGGGWTGGSGVFLPDTADLNATYTPTAGEIAFGSVTLTLTTTGNRNCPSSSDVMTITIDPIEDPSFTYASGSYCQGDIDPSPTITGVGGGTFSGPAGLSINASTGAIDLSLSTAGATYTVTYTTPGTCSSSTTFDVAIVAEDDPSFTYTSASYCQAEANPSPTISGTPGGVFSSTAGLSINGGTGEINLAASTVGSYTVTYLTTGTCPNSTTFAITILGEDDPSFTYAAGSYCQAGADPTPTITGTAGGTFSAPAGLSINFTTGTIDASASTAGGPYTVTYTTSGSCPNSTTFDIIIILDDPSFSYPAPSYCQGDANPLPTVTGTPGGSFSAPAGLNVNAVTGEIDLAGSTAGGPYLVNYTTSVSCPIGSNFSITIIAEDDPTFTYAAASFCQGDTDPSPTISGTPGGTFSAPAGVSINASSGIIDLSASSAGGPYAITYTTAGSCPNSTTFNVSIDAEDDPTFSYTSASYCQGDANPTPTISGTPGGTFSSTAGLSITAGTGEIDLAASTAGATYTVTYTTLGVCPNSTTINVAIVAEDDPTFTYTAANFCQGDVDPSPTITGTPGGSFSAPAGVSINGSNGIIDLSASTAGGPYLITYTTAGTCPNSTTFSLSIDAEDDPSFSYDFASYCQGDANPTPTISGTPGGTFSSTAGLSITAGTGEIDLAASTAGATYTVTYTTLGVCPNSTTFNVAIVAEDDPAFTYAAANFCQGDADPLPTITGTPAGTFSATAGVSINLSTGLIDLSASTAGGPYTITYTTPGSCPNSTTFILNIDAEDDPTFSYASVSYCQGEANPTPTISGTPGGTFSSTAGLSITAGTGEIDLAASTAGATYTVTYTTLGACPNFTTFNVSIVAEDDPSFTYPLAGYCQDDVDPTPTITGTVGGTFTAPAAVSINLLTGVIDLSASSAGGPYAITYTTAGTCANSTTFNITITATDDPTFSYSSATFCQSGSDPTPVISGLGGGTFSEASGDIVFVSTATGEIDLGASTLGGPYSVVYTTNGPCPTTLAVAVTITSGFDASFTYGGSPYCEFGADPSPTFTTGSPGTFTSSPAGVNFISVNTGEVNLTTSTPGSYRIYNTIPASGGCVVEVDSFDIDITPIDDPSFSYTAASYCQGDANPIVTISGTGGGGFVATAGLSVDAVSGEINLAASTVGGPYTITYTTVGACPDNSSVFVSVEAEEDPSFTYDAGSYCQSDTDPTPTITGTVGGTFTAPAGVIINAGTGAIDLSASTPGTSYSITYTTPGTCSNSTTFDVDIVAEDDPSFSYSAVSYCQGDANPTVTISGTPGGGFTATAGLSVDAVTGEIDLAASTIGGPYTITYTTVGTCPNSSTFFVSVTAEEDPAFTYDALSYCQGDTDPTPTITGTIGGTFTAPAGVVINAATGEVDLSASTVGTSYTITYTTPGTCSNSTTFDIDIVAEDDPSFSYTAASYCQDDANPTATISGTPGGGFTATAGLSVDAVTGEIDLAASTIGGPYIVTYTTIGTCPNSANFIVSVTAEEDPAFTYDAGSYCQGGADPMPTITGTIGGVFTAPAGVVINASTGEIDLSASTVGTSYSITYTTPGTCSNSTTFDIDIVAEDDPSFSYAETSFCQSGVNPTPTITGDLGGVFSAVAGLIVDAGSGEINISASTPGGPYAVTYTTTGTCPNSSDFNVSILDSIIVDAGLDQTVCYHAANVDLSGTVPFTGVWDTDGTGTFSPNDSLMTATYIPSLGDSTSGTVFLTLTSTNNGNCAAAVDSLEVTINPGIYVDAGASQTVCADTAGITLSGMVDGATRGRWTTSGGGTFSPNDSTVIATYIPGPLDATLDSVLFVLTSVENGLCLPVTDVTYVTITPTPVVDAGDDLGACSTNAVFSLTGTVSGGSTTGRWTTSGSGVFTPNDSSLVATYTASDADTTAGGVTVYLTSINNGLCNSVLDSAVLTITSGINLDPGTGGAYCSNNADIDLLGLVSGATTTGQWTTSGNGSFAPNDSTLNAVYSSSPDDTLAGSLYLILTSTNNGGCQIETDSIQITYTPSPIVFAGIDQSVCANNASTSLTGTITAGASLGKWSSSGTGGFSPNSTDLNTTYVPSAADTLAGSVTIRLTTTDHGICLPVVDSMIITIEPTPQVFAGDDILACNDDTPQLGGSIIGGMETATWTTLGSGTFAPDADSLNAVYTPSSADTLAGSVLLVLTSTNNLGCIPVTDTLDLSFTPRPTVAIDSLDGSVCGNNANINIYGSVSGSTTTGQWSTSGTGTFSPNDSSLIAVYVPSVDDIAAGSVLITLSSTNSCLAIDTATALITPGPQVDADVDQFICIGDMDVVLNGSISGTTTEGRWTTTGTGTFAPNDSTLNATYNLSVADSIAGTFDLILSSINNGACNANVDTMTVLTTTVPDVDPGTGSTACANTPLPLSGIVTGGSTTGVWTTSGDGTFTPDSTDLNAFYLIGSADEIAGSVRLYLTSTFACAVDSDSIDIIVTPSPIADAGTPIAVCSNNADVDLNGNVSGITTTGRWSTDGLGTFVPDDSTLNATYIPDAADIAAGSLAIVLSTTNNGDCNPDVDTVMVSFGDPPAVDAGTDPIICVGDISASLDGSVSGVTTMGRWTTLGSGSFTPNDSTLNADYVLSTNDSIAGSITLILTSINNAGCNANSDTVVVSTTTVPSVNAGFDDIACANTQIVVIGDVSDGTTTGVWSTTGNGTFVDSSSLNAVYSFGSSESASGFVQLILTSTGACVDITDTVDITVTPSPVVDAGSNLVVCHNNSTVVLNGDVSVATTTGVWSTPGTGGFIPNDSTLNSSYIPSVDDKEGTSIEFTLSSTNNGDCAAETDQMIVTISPSPEVDAGPDQVICSVDSASLAGLITVSATEGIWTTSGTGTFVPNATTLDALYAPSDADTAAGMITLTLTTTDHGSCIAVSDDVEISIVTKPSVNAGSNVTLCANNGDVNVVGLVSGTTTTGIWSSTGTGSFTPNDSSLTATYVASEEDEALSSFEIILIATNSCFNADTLDVTYTLPPSVDAGSDPFVCISNPTVNLVGTVADGATTGIWSTLGTGTFDPNDSTLIATYNPSVADSTAGTVYLILTSTNNGDCNAESDSMLVSIVPPPVVDAGIDDTVCANVPVQLAGQITIGATEGVWESSGTGYFVPDSLDLNALYVISSDDSLAGEIFFTLTPTNFFGCPVTIDTMEAVITPAPYAFGGPDVTVCENNDTVYVVGQIFGPTSTGVWESFGSGTFLEDDTTLINRYVPSQEDIDNELVVLSLSTTENGNCFAETYLLLANITPEPGVDVGMDQVVCNDDVVSLDAIISGGATGAYWTSTGTGTFIPDSSALDAMYQPSAADTIGGGVTLYATTVDTSNCIGVVDTLQVQFTPRPIVLAGPNDTVCANNANVDLAGDVSGSTTDGIWSTTGTGVFTPSDTILNATYVPGSEDSLAGVVTLILSSRNACLVTDTLTVLITPAPVVLTGKDQILCEGDTTAVLTGSVTGGSTTGIWTTLGTGYFTPNDSALNATYVLSAQDTTNRAVTLVLESTNNGDCFSVIDTLEITITSIPVVNAGLDDTLCSNTSLALNGTVTGGAGLGVWSTLGGGTFADSSDLLTDFINPPAGTVELVLTSVEACVEIMDTVEMEVLPEPELTISLLAPVCIDNRILDLVGTVENAGSVQWSTLGTGVYTSSDTELTTTFAADEADSLNGFVTIILTSVDNGICNAVSISEDIFFSEFPIADAGSDIYVCTEDELMVSLNGMINGGSSTGIWTTDGTGSFFPNDSTLIATYLPSEADTASGSITMVLTSTNNGSCSPSSDSVLITWVDPPVLSILTSDTVCTADIPVLLDVSMQGQEGIYTWITSGTGTFSPSDTTINAEYTPSADDITNGSVQLVLSSIACPTYLDSVDLTFFPSPVANYSYTSSCGSLDVTFVDSSTIDAGNIVAWNWSYGDGGDTVQNPTYTFPTFGTSSVTLIVESDNGCTDTTSQTIVRNIASANFGASGCLTDLMSFMDSSLVEGDSVVTWIWDFGDGGSSSDQNPTYTYREEQDQYEVTLFIVTAGGCTDSTTISVSSDCIEGIPAVPTGFTPNGDNNNDVLYVDGGPFTELDFRIYNEWGEVIFQATDQATGWDGKKKEIEQPLGVYVYTVKATTVDGVKHELKGTVTLVR